MSQAGHTRSEVLSTTTGDIGRGRLGRLDLIQLALSVGLAVAVFLPWYATSSNPASNVDGQRGTLSAWDVYPIMRWVLLAAAVCGLCGAWQTARAQPSQLPRGEITVIIATFIAGLIAVNGLFIRPGEPSGTISLQYGWFIALAASLGAIVTGLLRQPPRPQKPL